MFNFFKNGDAFETSKLSFPPPPPFFFLQNANSCPVDRIIFKSICVRVRFDGEILKKVGISFS